MHTFLLHMTKNILSLSKKFIKIKSVEGNKDALNSILNLALSYLGDFTIEKFEKNGVKSALVYNTKKRPKKFKLLITIHLDVIEGKDSQYKPKIIGDKLYGVGSMDMKANAACVIFAFKELANSMNYPMALQIVTDEEVGGLNGAKYQVSKGVRADFVLASEPTNFDIVHQAKGVLQIKVSCKGISSHGAYPWRGDNAVWKMNNFLNILNKKFPNPKKEAWKTTFNLSSLNTNNKVINKIPDSCEAVFDIRYIKEDQKTILSDLKKILPKGFKLDVLVSEPPMFTQKNNEYILNLASIAKKYTKKSIKLRGANGTSDVGHFSKKNCSGIEFGPIGGDIGGDKEFVSIKSLDVFYKILIDFIKAQNK